MAVKDLVESSIQGSTITVFSKTWCPYCRRAKALLAERFPDVDTKVLELDNLEEGAEIQDYLQQKTGQRSVPNVFIRQKHVGGCDTVVSLDEQGRLIALVNA